MPVTYAEALAKFKVAHGKWTPTTQGEKNEWNGTCQKCGRTQAAVGLSLVRLPFGRGESWVCKGGCE